MALFGNKNKKSLDSIREASVGQEVTLGVFPQDKKGKKLSPIIWQVLERKNGQVLLISKYALLGMQFHTRMAKWNEIIGWEKSSLRSWLNSEFFEKSFSPEEKAIIMESDVPAHENPAHNIKPGNATKDRLFLLSIPEAEKYFPTDDSRRCQMTKFVKASGVFTTDNGGDICRWWLRTPGYNQNRVACVGAAGQILPGGENIDIGDECCIRPAIWVAES